MAGTEMNFTGLSLLQLCCGCKSLELMRKGPPHHHTHCIERAREMRCLLYFSRAGSTWAHCVLHVIFGHRGKGLIFDHMYIIEAQAGEVGGGVQDSLQTEMEKVFLQGTSAKTHAPVSSVPAAWHAGLASRRKETQAHPSLLLSFAPSGSAFLFIGMPFLGSASFTWTSLRKSQPINLALTGQDQPKAMSYKT